MQIPNFRLDGQKAIITGAGRGIGRALAIGYAQAGAEVALVSRTQSDLEEVRNEITSFGGRALAVPADLRNPADIERAMDDIISQWREVDILVNNAGMNIRTPAMDVSEEEWETIMQTNLKSAFLFSQLAARNMKEHGGGKIISISSVAGQTALRTGVVYAATKAGLIQMTKNLALEWAKHGIRVNAIGPWYFRTPLTAKLLADEAYLGDIVNRTPMGRVGELEELVGPAVFLASDAASYITGQTLFVDGGMTIYGF